MGDVLMDIKNAIINGQNAIVKEKVAVALREGLNPVDILNSGMADAMVEVGRRFEQGEAFVPEMLLAARAMQSGLTILRDSLMKAEFKATGKVAIATVKGDLHDIGKNLVGMMLEGAGFEVIDLGTDVPPDKVVAAVKECSPDIVALSALLTTTMSSMKATIDALKTAGLRDSVKVIIGGAPITEQYAQQIGADGFSLNAARAVTVAKDLIGEN